MRTQEADDTAANQDQVRVPHIVLTRTQLRSITVVRIISWTIRCAALFAVPQNRKPSSATAWLMLVFLFPFLGAPLFLLIGSPKLSRRRRAQQSAMDEIIHGYLALTQDRQELAPIFNPLVPPRFASLIRLNTNLGFLPAFGGNQVELVADYPTVFQRLAQDIDQARSYVHMEYFALSSDRETEPVFAALERAQQRGIAVRVLLDHLGSRKYVSFKGTCARLEAAGIEYHLALPVRPLSGDYSRPDLRNHRKIVVIDGLVGYTGSQNLIKRNYFRADSIYYDELVARVAGPIAMQLNAAFMTDWNAETGLRLDQTTPAMVATPTAAGDMICQVLPSGSGFENENNLRFFTGLIHAAQRKLVITNPYFVPDDALMTAITSAAQRGVEVTLINSEVSDQFLVSHAQRSYYDELFAAGVQIYWYPAPILLHAKTISVDDDVAVIGSSNLDMRSFQLNLEVTLIVYDARVVADLRRIEAEYLRKGRVLQPEEWQARSVREKLAENLARLTSALQ